MSNEKNIYITSHNQSGGVTAHTVNFGPTARTMNAQLGGHLKERIPTTAKVTITAVLGDGEAFSFANQVMTWLLENGYANVNGVNQAVYSQPVMGQTSTKLMTSNLRSLLVPDNSWRAQPSFHRTCAIKPRSTGHLYGSLL